MSDLGVEMERGTAQEERSSSVKNRVGFIATCALGGSLVALYSVAGPFIAPALRKICLPFVPATNTQVKNVLSVLQSRSGTLVDIGSGDGRIVSHFQFAVYLSDKSLGAVPFETLRSRLKRTDSEDESRFNDSIPKSGHYRISVNAIYRSGQGYVRSRAYPGVEVGTVCEVIAAARQGFRSVGFELNPWLVWYSRYKAWRQGVRRNTSFYISDLWKVSFSQYSNVVIFGVPQMMEQLEAKLQAELQSSARVVACRFPFPTWTPDDVTGEGIDTVWVYDAKTFKSHTKPAKLLNNSEDKNHLR